MSSAYRYVIHPDTLPEFFRGEEKITEEEWRREAAPSEVLRFEAEQRAPAGGPFPKDIAAS